MANLTKEQRLAREAEKQAQIEKEIEARIRAEYEEKLKNATLTTDNNAETIIKSKKATRIPLDTIVTVAEGNSSQDINKQQVKIELEDQLKNLFDPINKQHDKKDDSAKINDKVNNKNNKLVDFGLGPAQTISPEYIANGIALW